MVDLTVSVLSWNVRDLLKECLESIFDRTQGITYKVIVVDNGSIDGSPEMVKKDFAQAKLIENNANLGFTKANNKVMKVATGRYVILLNSDTIILDNAFKKMVDYMDQNPQVGCLGPKLLNADQTLQRSCKTFPTLRTQLVQTLCLDQLFPKSKIFGSYMMTNWDHKTTREVDQVMGAAIMVRREVIGKVGMLDENIIFWYDEVDWCFRIKQAGYKVVFLPQAEIIHYQGEGFKQWKNIKKAVWGWFLFRRSRNYFFKKHYGFWQVPILILMDIFQLAIFVIILYLILNSALFLIVKAGA